MTGIGSTLKTVTDISPFPSHHSQALAIKAKCVVKAERKPETGGIRKLKGANQEKTRNTCKRYDANMTELLVIC